MLGEKVEERTKIEISKKKKKKKRHTQYDIGMFIVFNEIILKQN